MPPTVDGPLTLDEAYEKYGTELLHFAASLVGPHAAQDLVSQTFLDCLNGSWDRVVNARAYLYRAVRNGARKHYRTEQRRTARELRFGVRGPSSEDESEYEPEVLAAVNALSLQQRSVTYLAYWLDLDAHAIAELLGVSLGTVHRHLARARASLRRRIDDER